MPLILAACLLSLAQAAVPAAAQQYFPPPEARGGWRTTTDPAVIRGLGLDPTRLNELGRYSLSIPSWTGRTGTLVIKNGWVVGEWYDTPEGRSYRYRLASNSKSVAMLLFGRMVEESRRGNLAPVIGLDSYVYDQRWLPEGFPLSDARKARVTFRHVFQHRSGIVPEAAGDVRGGPGWDFLPYTVGHDPDYPGSAPLYFEPGTRQRPWGELDLTTGYSSVAFNHLTFIIPRVTGVPANEYLRRALLDPIGVGAIAIAPAQGYKWPTSTGLHMTARDFARVAYLMLREGRWGDRQLVPGAWLATFTGAPDYPNIRSNVDGHFGAQYPPDLYRTMGSGLNWAFIVPSLDLIAIRVGRADNWRYRAVEAAFLRKLFAAVVPAGAAPPAVPPAPRPSPQGVSVTSFTLIDADTNQPVEGFDPLRPGTTVQLSALPGRRLNVRANTSPAVVGSVVFGLDGNARYRTENRAPYALAGDTGPGDYMPWTPTPGRHTLTATPFSGPSGAGGNGVTLSVTFYVIE